jgi:sugar transferase (PEP-CTERM/EpsH1 system associated)
MGDILFLAHRIPYPPNRGDKIRSFNILKRLCQLGTVHVATFADDDEDMGHADTLRPMLGSLHIEKRTVSKPVGAAKAIISGKPISLTLFDSSRIRKFVTNTMAERSIDTVFVFSGQMAQFVPELPAETRFIMDFGDVDSAKFAAYAQSSSAPMRYVHAREARTLATFEKVTAARANCSTFVSEAEAALFRTETGLGEDRVQSLENGINCGFFDPAAKFTAIEKPEGRLIIFTGQMDYRPNVEAVISFADDALHAIHHQSPHAKFAIVGRNPTNEVQRLAKREGIIVTGGVKDIRGWLAAADVVVAPLRMARGIQNKVLEAMAMARPVVASTPAFEGIDAAPGQHLMVADSVADEAHMVIDLLENPVRGDLIGQAARKRMLERYVWDQTLAPLARLTGQEPTEVPQDDLAGVR